MKRFRVTVSFADHGGSGVYAESDLAEIVAELLTRNPKRITITPAKVA